MDFLKHKATVPAEAKTIMPFDPNKRKFFSTLGKGAVGVFFLAKFGGCSAGVASLQQAEQIFAISEAKLLFIGKINGSVTFDEKQIKEFTGKNDLSKISKADLLAVDFVPADDGQQILVTVFAHGMIASWIGKDKAGKEIVNQASYPDIMVHTARIFPEERNTQQNEIHFVGSYKGDSEAHNWVVGVELRTNRQPIFENKHIYLSTSSEG
jgi:hypothetical protein